MGRDKKNEPQQTASKIIGRISGANPSQEATNQLSQADISYVDQQEGNMNNGSCGGNFDSFDAVARDPSDDRSKNRG